MAGILSGQQQQQNRLVLQDLIPLSLGVKLGGDIMDIIIKKQSAIPIAKVKEYATTKDN